MGNYIIRRLLLIVVNLLTISIMVFAGLRLLKGDLAIMLLGRQDIVNAYETASSPDELAAFREQLGLNDPVPIQYAKWLGNILKGDFGQSAYTREPAVTVIGRTLPVTIQLALMATLIAWLLGLPIGLLAAVKQDTPLDSVMRLLSISGLAIPGFWLGGLLITVPAVLWGWTPLKTYVSLMEDMGTNLLRMFWPALILGISMAAWLMRMTRAAMVEVMQRDYIRTARSRGFTENRIVIRHALKNSLIPVLATSGIQFGGLLAGTVIIEELFLLPGMGRLLVQSILLRDYAVVQAAVLYFAFGVSLVNLIVDVLFGFVNPRIRYD